MSHLLNARSKNEEIMLRDMVGRTITALRAVPEGGGIGELAFDQTAALIIADLIEIGAAPGKAQICNEMRMRAQRLGRVQIRLEHDFAASLAQHIEVGLIRHESGVENAAAFTLH